MPRSFAPFAASACLLTCAHAASAQPGITIYNQNFGVVRETIRLDLQSGSNRVQFTDTTALLEPDSVILRDPAGKRVVRILEQNFRSDPISQELLLSKYEGQSIDFLVHRGDRTETIRGRIVRSGYVPHTAAFARYGSSYYASQTAYARSVGQPIVEVDGKLRFGLPGIPQFPALGDDTVLKPTLHWVLETDKAGPLAAELAYVTGGMSWKADYNVIAPEQGDVLELVGWVTMDNQSGRTFENARIKLMAGDVSKIQPQQLNEARGFAGGGFPGGGSMPAVTERGFDEYHLYTLERPTTLRDRETKQVEFVRASGIKSQRIYVYEGAKIDTNRYRGSALESIREAPDYGTQSNPKVWVMREFMNSEANRLGMPLPRGRMRFYRRDGNGPLEFTGENIIDHTPRNERVRVYTGNAFDIVGERRRTNYKVDHAARTLDESFEITLRNHKKEAVAVRVVERLYRWTNWEITAKSDDWRKLESQTVEFPVEIKPDEEKTVTYTVRYTW